MKRVLITGAGSYVGTHVMRRLQEEPDKFEVRELDVKGDAWRGFDFAGFDAVFHVAGIAHVSTDPSMEPLYMQVNRDLAIEVAERAKESGVGQFVFMSSSIVYGDSKPAGKGEPITLSTAPAPANFYGRSKFEAEEGLRALDSSDFAVAVIRAPMIFGANAKGNFPKLVSIALRLPFFPLINNQRSMLYVGNLAELVAGLVTTKASGVFLPQQEKPICTSELVTDIAQASGRLFPRTKVFNPILKGPMKSNTLVVKAFGDLYYDLKASDCGVDYRRYTTKEAVRAVATEEGWRR